MKNILITGISKGLGLEITKIFIDNDYFVYGISRSKSEELDRLLKGNPEKVKWISFDLSNTEDVNDKIFNKFIPLDIPIAGFINNAAIAYDDIVTNLQMEPLERMYRVNVFTPMMMTKYVIRNMIYQRIKGSIVHLSSVSVHTGYKGLAMYASTKGALEAFSKNTAREWGARKIRSNCLVAGFMETEMSATLTDEQKSRIYKRTSLKQATTTNSVANMAEFLISNKSESITGQNIHVDSGTI
ncbi:MAG: SDR family NAD(P)-dependent oxidoreductase [bacterium]